MLKFIKSSKNIDYFFNVLVTITFLLTLIYSYILAYKRYVNFEYGKFDLGNMAQMLYNTLNGNFMVLTDQFGTNMPRWGMSHVDPVILLIAPFFKLIPHPMTLVFIQHVVIISAIFPLYWLTKKYLKSSITAFIFIFVYILYPANGFTLVWTGYHGISFIAPLLIWLLWFLEKNNYLIDANIRGKGELNKGNLIKNLIYWILILLMLLGKEEVGAMLFIASFFLYLKNKRLAIQTGILSLLWFILAFFVIIPHYSYMREESINNFVETAHVEDYSDSAADEENFFFFRYSYLGNSYPEMIKTILTKPGYVYNKVVDESKKDTVIYMLGPFGFIVVTGLFWIISIPDLAITFLSNEPIFNIYNHRMAFVIISLFISQLIIFKYLRIKSDYLLKVQTSNKLKIFFVQKFNLLMFIYVSVLLIFTFYYSYKSNNPLFLSSKSLVENKIIAKVFASDISGRIEDDSKYVIGQMRSSKVPRNNVKCLNNVVDLIYQYDPQIYTGPDYLGAHSSLRNVNALFPARYWDADMVVADVFETKTLGPLGESGWTFNKWNLKNMYNEKKVMHLYSCGKVNIFVQGDTKDKIYILKNINEKDVQNWYDLESKKIYLKVKIIDVPDDIYVDELNVDNAPIKLNVLYKSGDFHDKVTFFTLQSKSTGEKYSFIDYLTIAGKYGLDSVKVGTYISEEYHIKPSKFIPKGEYYVFYGVGDLLRAKEIYLGTTAIK